jgi:hypothetical protein
MTHGHQGPFLAPASCQQHGKAALQYVVDRFPVHAGRFHRHVSDPLRGHPVCHRLKVSGHRVSGARLFVQSASGIHPPHTRFDRLLVDVQTGTTRENLSISFMRDSFRPGWKYIEKLKETALRALAQARRLFGVRNDVQARLTGGLAAPKLPGLGPAQGESIITRLNCIFMLCRCHKAT